MQTAPGEVYTAGLQRITCGDSGKEAVVADLWESVDDRASLTWCDPPYGIDYGAKTVWMEERGAQRKRSTRSILRQRHDAPRLRAAR